jgi:hypothetical protein
MRCVGGVSSFSSGRLVHRLLDTDSGLLHLREMKNDCGETRQGKVTSEMAK